jgi:hypothetical protein
MNVFRVFPKLFFSIALLSFCTGAFAGELDRSKCTPLNVLIEKGKLRASIQGVGGHEGECISISLFSTSDDTSYLWLEPGRILQSVDTSVQDILITREEMLVLAPGEQRELTIFGFCSQASLASPDSSEQFLPGQMADSTVVLLARFLNERDNNFPVDAIQGAVWCLTDNHDIRDISGEDMASIHDLINYVADLKGLDFDYTLAYDQAGNDEPYSQSSVTITGDVQVYFPSDCQANISIVNSEGVEYESFEKLKSYKSGIYNFTFRFTSSNWTPGNYYFIVECEGTVIYRKEFSL